MSVTFIRPPKISASPPGRRACAWLRESARRALSRLVAMNLPGAILGLLLVVAFLVWLIYGPQQGWWR